MFDLTTILNFLWITFKYLPLIIFIWIPILLYYYFLIKLSYWKRHNVPYIPGLPFIGNCKALLTFEIDFFGHLSEFYFHPKFRDQPIIGYHKFHKNALIIRDIELVKQILIRDFQKFPNRNARVNLHGDEMGATCLFLARNPMWKTLRSRTSPCFAFNRVRKMFGLINTIGNELNQYLLDNKLCGKVMEFKEVAACYTTDIVASCAFGVNVNSFRDGLNGFREAGRKFFEFTIVRGTVFLLVMNLPDFGSFFNVKFFPSDTEKFFRKSIHHIINEREKSGLERYDLIDALIELKKEDKEKVSSTSAYELVFKGDVLVAQAAVFFAAGFESSATLITFTLFHLAWNQKIQNRLREEIQRHLKANNNELSAENVNQMEYLDMVFSETLRYYPILPFIDRECALDANEEPYSLEPYSSFKIPNGMPIIIPVHAIHHDQRYFPNPSLYDPERFSAENKHNIQPGTYMPFGLGPRKCIAEFLGLMQSKVALINIFKNHLVKPSPNTPKVITFSRKSFSLGAINGIHLEIYKI